ncbi:Rho-GTPase-activating protein 8 [Coemansia biformis]|uniref:Rho-GTPase-activating protein 8 n=1 Tax=Coemansia biformis TaxID=1286918 RepID=A0A9W7Y8T4_9FUNG|nr:Rho-GTPase-activating protein 8 [Coemansia biformis]
MQKFENSFWDNPGPGQQPHYGRGPQCLFEKLEQGSVECDELLAFFRERAAIEEAYASSLQQLAARKLSAGGFGRDEGATLKTAYRGLLTECVMLAEAHTDLAVELQSSVIVPLRNFASEHRARVHASWKMVDDTIRRATSDLAQVDRNHRAYAQKASAAEQMRPDEEPEIPLSAELEVKTRPSMAAASVESADALSAKSTEDGADADVARQRQQLAGGADAAVLSPVHGELGPASIVLGNVALTRHEFHVMLQRMQTEVPQHDVKFGILGTFRGLISGESLAGWWCINYPTVVRSEADALAVGQSMMSQGYLRFMGRGSQFQSRSNAYYQWKRPALEFQSDEESDSDNEPLTSRRAQLGSHTSYERAQRAADEAGQVYRDSVARAELVRTGLEEQLTNYLETMEVWELNRLMSVKSMLGEYARINKRPVEAELGIGDRLEVYEESIKPQQDIQWGIENYGTGRFTPRPILFHPFGRSAAEFQVFGVALDEQLLVSHKDIPLMPAKALSLIRKSACEMAPEDRYRIWTARVLLNHIHELRNAVNKSPQVTLRQLRAFDLPTVASVLILYLLELPQPLCPEELHGPLRAVYSSRSEKNSTETLKTLRTLLEGTSYAHLKTMQTLFGTLHDIVSGDDTAARGEFVRAVSKRLGPVVVRGIEIVGAGASRIPELFAADLIEHYDTVLAKAEATRPFPPALPPVKSENEDESATVRVGAHTAGAASGAAAALADTDGLAPRAASSGGDAGAARLSSEAAEAASKRSSAGSSLAGRRASALSASSSLPRPAPGSARGQVSFDEDERLVDNILEDTNEPGGGGDSSMDYFLKDEDDDASDDEADEDSASGEGGGSK